MKDGRNFLREKKTVIGRNAQSSLDHFPGTLDLNEMTRPEY